MIIKFMIILLLEFDFLLPFTGFGHHGKKIGLMRVKTSSIAEFDLA